MTYHPKCPVFNRIDRKRTLQNALGDCMVKIIPTSPKGQLVYIIIRPGSAVIDLTVHHNMLHKHAHDFVILCFVVVVSWLLSWPGLSFTHILHDCLLGKLIDNAEWSILFKRNKKTNKNRQKMKCLTWRLFRWTEYTECRTRVVFNFCPMIIHQMVFTPTPRIPHSLLFQSSHVALLSKMDYIWIVLSLGNGLSLII